MELKRTALHDAHVALGARMVEFAGYSMPVQYVGLKEEHLTVRNHVGLFDVSHMGEIFFDGPKALETLQWLTTNDVAKLEEGQAQYSLLPNDHGGLVDDIIVYCLKKNASYLVCVNASNKDKDFAWMTKHNRGAQITDASAEWSQIAVQGPKAMELIADVFQHNDAHRQEILNAKPFQFIQAEFLGHPAIVAFTGYTGEKGCEIFIDNYEAINLWKILLKVGEKYGVKPCGLGARDTLRTEKKYSLYGNEIDDNTNPYAAGLGWVIKPTAKDFMGKSMILAAREKGLPEKLIGFKLLDKGIPRHGYELFDQANQKCGVVTSGTHSPSLNESIGIAYLRNDLCNEGSTFFVDIRGKKVPCKVAPTPFV